MEIELSWPAWLHKVLVIIFGILVFASFTHQVLVASMVPSEVYYTTNSTTAAQTQTKAVSQITEINNDWDDLAESHPQKPYNSAIPYPNIESQHKRVDDYSNLPNPNEPPSYTGKSGWNADFSDKRIKDSLVAFNETFWDLLDCDDFHQMELPPSFIEWIPPPPIPPFLSDKEILLNLNEEDISHSDKIAFDDQYCTLCSWAKSGVNITNEAELSKKQEPRNGIGKTMIATLIGVAMLSAAVGATIMAVLFKCKKKRNQTNERANSCPLVIYWRRWVNTSTHKIHHHRNSSTRDKNDSDVPTAATVSGERPQRSIALRLWRGFSNTSNQPPTLQTSSPDSANSCYSEEHYISGDTGSSVVYAELASRCNSQQVDSHVTGDQHHYSEIEDICKLSNLKRKSSDETYENFSYVLSDLSASTRPNDGSIYSTRHSVPSSAYYSDISSCELYAIKRNQRNKRKRKRNMRSNSERTYPFIVSSRTQSNPVIESRVASIHPLHLTQHQHNCIPETLQIINNTNQLVDPTRYSTRTTLDSLAIMNVTEPQKYLCCSQLNNFKGGSVSCSDTRGIDLYELRSNQVLDNRRSLPQRNYRQMSFPNNKRHLRALIQAQGLATVPSEYI